MLDDLDAPNLEIQQLDLVTETSLAAEPTAGGAPRQANSAQLAYPKVNHRPSASSSQPTGWRGRRLASSVPTVTALTAASR